MSFHYGKSMKNAMEYGEKVSGTGFGKMKKRTNEANGGHGGKAPMKYGKGMNVVTSKAKKCC